MPFVPPIPHQPVTNIQHRRLLLTRSILRSILFLCPPSMFRLPHHLRYTYRRPTTEMDYPLATKADTVSHRCAAAGDTRGGAARRPPGQSLPTPPLSSSCAGSECGLDRVTAVCDAAASVGRLDLLQSTRASTSACPWGASTMRWAA